MQQNYYNPYQNNFQYQQPQNFQRSVFVMINCPDEVKTFIVQPNQIAYLLDTTSNHFYIKKADMQGRYSLEEFVLVQAQQDSEEYVKKSDIAEIQSQIASLVESVKAIRGE